MRNFTSFKLRGFNRVQQAAYVNRFYKNSVQDKKITNTDTGIKIYFNNKGRNKTAKLYSSVEKAVVVLNIVDLLSDAKRVSTKFVKEDSALRKIYPDSIIVFNFLIRCKVDRKIKKFICGVVMLKDGNFQYSLYHNELREKK